MSMGPRALAVVLPLTILAFAACSIEGSTATTTTRVTTSTESPVTTTSAAPEDPPTTTTTTTTGPAPTTTTAPRHSLVVWTDETRAPIVEAVAVEFEAATGVSVEIEVVSFGNIRQDMTQSARLGAGADVFVGRHDWVAELAVNGVVEPLDLSGRADEFFPVALDAFSFRGNLYGLPFDMEAIGLIRNTDLVPEAPATFEELLARCDTLAETVTQCLALPAGDGYHHYPFLATTGGYIFGYDAATGYDTTDVGLDNDTAVAGFTFLDRLITDGYLDPAVNYDTMTDLFYRGEAAFMWTGPWVLPHLHTAVEEGALRGYAITPLPSIDGSPGTPFVGVQGIMLNAFSDKKALAQTFVLDYIGTEQVMIDLYHVGLRAPAHVTAFEAAASDPDVAAFGASAVEGDPIPNITEMVAVWDVLDDAVQAIYDQPGDPAAVLAAAAAAVRAAVNDG